MMYSKLILPNQLIQDIEFFHVKDFYTMSFLGKDYEIIAKDDVGNYIGMAPDKQVFYLETASDTHLDNMRYISRDIEAFMQELNLYKQYSDDYFMEENPSDKALREYADGFKKLVVAIEPDAFCDSESYWSVIAEQMEYEQI